MAASLRRPGRHPARGPGGAGGLEVALQGRQVGLDELGELRQPGRRTRRRRSRRSGGGWRSAPRSPSSCRRRRAGCGRGSPARSARCAGRRSGHRRSRGAGRRGAPATRRRGRAAPGRPAGVARQAASRWASRAVASASDACAPSTARCSRAVFSWNAASAARSSAPSLASCSGTASNGCAGASGFVSPPHPLGELHRVAPRHRDRPLRRASHGARCSGGLEVGRVRRRVAQVPGDAVEAGGRRTGDAAHHVAVGVAHGQQHRRLVARGPRRAAPPSSGTGCPRPVLAAPSPPSGARASSVWSSSFR